MIFRTVLQTMAFVLLAIALIGCHSHAAQGEDNSRNRPQSSRSSNRQLTGSVPQAAPGEILAVRSQADTLAAITEEWLPEDVPVHPDRQKPAAAGQTSPPAQPIPATDQKPDGARPTDNTEAVEIDWTAEEEELARIQPGRRLPDPQIEPLYVRVFTDIAAGQNDSNPIWSPTGDMIAFERSIADRREIIISHVNGSVLQKIYHRIPEDDDAMDFVFEDILDDASYNSGISWSPDESKLVFMSNGGSGNYDLYLLPVLGQEQAIRLTDHEERDSQPHWNPASDRLVFVSGRTGNADIFVMDLTARKVTKLTSGLKTYLYPQWSPDGKKIVMIYGSNENHDIFLIEDIDRPLVTLKALTTWRYDDLRPVWSPDGKKVAFYSNYNPENNPKTWSIVVIAADGSDPVDGEGLAAKIVAKNVIPDIERGLAWMPDSKRIIYVKNDQKSFNPIYVVDIEAGQNMAIKTRTKMNHDVTCSANGTLAFRAQVEQWDHIYIAKLQE